VIVVLFTTVRPLTVTPVPDTVTAVAPVRLVPVRVTGTLAPCVPIEGAIVVSVGPWTVNVTVLVVPPVVVTLTLCVPSVAPAAIVKVAVICVPVGFTEMPLAVTPVPAFIAEAPPG